MLKSQQEFIDRILPGAKNAHSNYGVLPSLTLCQAILESAWGKSSIGNNIFGIKANVSWKGKRQLVWTHEYVRGEKIKVEAYFKDYDSIDESIIDHAKLLTLSRYKPVLAAKDYKEACIQVQKCGYATDPKYSDKLISIIEKYNLNQYDEVNKMAKYSKIALTHVIEVDPMQLKISIQDKAANKINLPNMVTPGYITWEAVFENGKKTNRVKAVPLSILASEGKIICNRQPHDGPNKFMYPAGTLIVYRDGKVAVKSITDLTQEKDVWFAVGGCSILPGIKMKEEGFCKRINKYGKNDDFSDIGKVTNRPVIGYNPKTNKIIIAVRPDSNIERGRQTLINLGCTMGITLDGGGSTVLKVGGKSLFNTTRQLYSVITWV